MSYWMPGAIHKPLYTNYTNARRSRTDAVIFHVAVSEAATLHGWFSNPRARASSHFYVRRDGTIEQYIPIDRISWAGVKSDNRAISTETQGMGHGKWTEAQIKSMLAIFAFCKSKYPGIPTRLMTTSKKNDRGGFGYHLLGVPKTIAQKLRGISQTGGELWSGAVGKICPGPARVSQMPTIVNRYIYGDRGKPGTPPNQKTTKRQLTTTKSVGCVADSLNVKTVQAQLRDAGYYKGVIDGIDGDMTKEAIRSYQGGQRYFPGLLVDAFWGELTQKHYIWVKQLQAALNNWKTAGRIGKTKVDGDYGSYSQKLVTQTINDNFRGTYTKAVKKKYGITARPDKHDRTPGPAFCYMLGIPSHPTATK